MALNQKKGGIILSYAMLILNALLKFVYTPFLLHKLGQEEYGLYSLAITIISYLSILDMGFGSTIVKYATKFISENRQDKLKGLYSTVSLIYLIIGFLAFIISVLLALGVNILFSDSMTILEMEKMKIMMFICGINLFFSFPLQIASYVLVTYERFIFRNLVNLLKVLLMPAFMVMFILLLDFKSVGSIIVVSSFNLITFLSFYIYARRKLNFRVSLNTIDISILKPLIRFSFSIFLLMIVDQLQFNSGQFVCGMFLGTKEVAIWGIAMIFVLNYRSIGTSISNVFIPSILKDIYNKEYLNLETKVLKMIRIQIYVLTFTLLNYILVGRDFLNLWAGDKYLAAYSISLAVMIPMSIGLAFDFCYSIQLALNHLKYRIITLYGGFVVALIILFFVDMSMISYALVLGVSIFIGKILGSLFYIKEHTSVSIRRIVFSILKILSGPAILTILYYNVIYKNHVIFINSPIANFIINLAVFNILLLLVYLFFSIYKEDKKLIFSVK